MLGTSEDSVRQSRRVQGFTAAARKGSQCECAGTSSKGAVAFGTARKLTRRESFGLWLARMALSVSGNPELASISRVLPLIRERCFLICAGPLDLDSRAYGSRGTWAYWDSDDVRGADTLREFQ
jgi:hypothetical protein